MADEHGIPLGSDDGSTGELVPLDDGRGYSWPDAAPLVLPIVVVAVVVAIIIVGLHFLQGPADGPTRLGDMDASGSFTLSGDYEDPAPPYGGHAWWYNLTLRSGDTLVLRYTSSGPPGGIQVRLQHPLHPQQAEPVEVYASWTGENGSISYVATFSGACQVYFNHPGAARPPDDPDAHQYATVTYDLEVKRAHRP